ncbi:hypothetical protein [Glaciecola sp. 1036]|uniref:hypothetical protein n=1 Tax=Alteromonadaceae TaxID=72275 RepID=UPI003CFE5181
MDNVSKLKKEAKSQTHNEEQLGSYNEKYEEYIDDIADMIAIASGHKHDPMFTKKSYKEKQSLVSKIVNYFKSEFKFS